MPDPKNTGDCRPPGIRELERRARAAQELDVVAQRFISPGKQRIEARVIEPFDQLRLVAGAASPGVKRSSRS
jgi:hypothetical protein